MTMGTGILFFKHKLNSVVASCLSGLVLMMINIPFVCAETVKTLKIPDEAVKRTSVVGGENVLGVMSSLVLVVAIIFLLAWVMKRVGGTSFRSNALLKVIGGVSMGSRERIVLIQIGEEQLLIGVAPGRIQTLHVLDKPVVVSDMHNVPAGSFSERLKSIINKEK